MQTIQSLRARAPFVLTAVAALLVLAAPLAAQPQAPDDELIDADITRAVEEELLIARGVRVDSIDVDTQMGVVTLSGTVDNILARDRAERLAQKVRGVRSVVNQIVVRPSTRTDAQVREDVLDALATDPATEAWEIDVEVTAGAVTLTGVVDSWREEQLATRVAKGVEGVRSVNEALIVEYDRERPDSEIENDVEQALRWDARVADALIEVEVEDGIVTLSGPVGSAYERSLAVADAWVMGVDGVDADDLEVRPWARDEMERLDRFTDVTDAEIEQAVKDALLLDPRVASFRPQAEVENGVVTLTGVVDNLKAKRAAAQDAANTVGVYRVKNRLKIRPTEERTDEQIAEEIRADLAIDPFVDRYEIDVTVDNAVARLTGTVDSYYEKWQAGDVALTAPGVVALTNQLQVEYEPLDYETWFYDWDPVETDYDLVYDVEMRKSDWEIREDIQSELFWSPFVDADEVAVIVDDAEATLTGTVDSWLERNKATENALEGGALRVDNQLEIEPGLDVPVL